MKKQTCQITNLKKLRLLTKKILKNLKGFNLLTLSGELGSGKTTFTKLLGKELKIKNKINSPSFVLMKIYQVPTNKYKIKYLCHADFYRTEKSSGSFLTEYINNPEVLTVIEWPEKIKKMLGPRIEIKFKIIGKKIRKVIVVPKFGKKKRAWPPLAA